GDAGQLLLHPPEVSEGITEDPVEETLAVTGNRFATDAYGVTHRARLRLDERLWRANSTTGTTKAPTGTTDATTGAAKAPTSGGTVGASPATRRTSGHGPGAGASSSPAWLGKAGSNVPTHIRGRPLTLAAGDRGSALR